MQTIKVEVSLTIGIDAVFSKEWTIELSSRRLGELIENHVRLDFDPLHSERTAQIVNYDANNGKLFVKLELESRSPKYIDDLRSQQWLHSPRKLDEMGLQRVKMAFQ